MKQSYQMSSKFSSNASTTHNNYRQSMSPNVSRVISFTSGKGGVGKTTLVVNTAIGLARLGKSVLILDADLGLANVDIMLGIKPKYTLQDLFEKKRSLKEIIVNGTEGISIIPAASGVESLCNLTSDQCYTLMEAVEEIAHTFDYLLIDTQAGIGSNVMYFNSAASEIVCVINPEPTSMTDAYALIKVLARDYGEKKINVVANQVADEKEGWQSFKRLSGAVNKYLSSMELNYLGWVPKDPMVVDAIREQKPLVGIYPSSRPALALNRLAARIDEEFVTARVKGGMQFFFKQLLEQSSANL